MKHNSFILTCLFAIFMAMPVFADNPAGYTIFGPNKYGYTDLTSKVSVQAQGSITYESGVFTGKGLPGRICETGDYLQLTFTEATAMTLSDNYAIHITLSKVGEPAGNVQVSFCNNGWNATRVSYIIENIVIAGEDIALNFTDRNGNNWNSYGETNSYGENRSFSGEIFRICAASGEQFAISQIYIKANVSEPDPIEPSGDEDAPTNLTAVVKSVADVSAVITASAVDASAIRFNVYNGTDVIATATSTSGVAKDIEVKGLTPETDYTLAVEAVDAAGNVNTNRVNVTFTTTEQLEKRYYFFRAGDIPTIEGMTAVDLRGGVGTNFTYGNNMTQTTVDNNARFVSNGSWCSFNQILKSSTDMSDVKQDSWTLVVKMRTTITHTSFNIRLNGKNPCYQVNKGNLSVSSEWQELKLALKDSKETLSFTNAMSNTIFQMHTDGSNKDEYIDIEYAYLTNVPTNPEKPAIIDDDPPTDVSIAVKDGSLSYDRLTLQLYAEDEDTPITYAVKYQVKNSGDTWTEVPTFTGAQGTTVEKEITGLTPETTYTFSVVASDPNGNAAEAVTTEATTTKLAEKRYYFFRTGVLPATTADLVAVDMRDGAGSTISVNQISKVIDRLFATYLMPKDWGFVQVKANAQSLDDVTSDWYLCVRYKSQHPGDVYANVACSNKQQVKIAEKENNDNLWKTKQIKIAEFTNNKTQSQFPVAANNDMFQFQTLNGGASVQGEFAVDYVYLTNSIAAGVDAGYVDGTAPVVTVEEKATTATAVTLTIEGTDDSDSKIVYTFSDGTNSEDVTKNSGETFDYTFENLTKGTEYTFTVDAKDLSNNAMTQIAKTITTPGGETKPEIQKFEAEATPTTITLTFNATDEDTEHQLRYTISDGTNEYNVQEMQGEDVVYTLKGLTPGTTYNLTLTATNASENTSDPSEKEVTTTYLKPSEFGVKIETVDMYNCVDHIAGDQWATTMEYRVVTYKNYILFQHKVLGDGQSVSDNPTDYNNQMWIGEYPLDSRLQELHAQYRPFDTRVRLTESQLTLNNKIGNEFDFDMYANNIFGVSGATCSQMQHFIRGYINTPSEDIVAPSIFSVNYEDKDGKRYLTIDANDNNNTTKDVFYYVKEGDNEYISLQAVVVPLKSDVTYECYAVDWNGNKSEKYEVHISAATIQLADNANNDNTINSWDNKLVNAKLTRTLSSAYYNTLCLPFGVEADQIVTVMGEGTKIAQLETARIKDNDELYLGFSFTDHIEAGVPYFVQPAQNVENPTFADVTINRNLQPTVIDGVITFQGIYNPTPLQAETEESHTILMLVANNQLTFPNVAGNMNGMRAYFKTSGAVAHIARRASFEVGEHQMPTELETIDGAQCTMHDGKYVINGRFVIVKENKIYNAQGQKVQ